MASRRGAFQLQTFHQFANSRSGTLQRARQQTQIVVAGWQRLFENRRIEQAFRVGADLRHALRKASREQEHASTARQHQHAQRPYQQRTPQLCAVMRYIKIHAEQRQPRTRQSRSTGICE